MYFFMEVTEDIINNMNYVIYVYEMLTNVELDNRKVYAGNNGEYTHKNEISIEDLYNEYKSACMYIRYITDSSLRETLKDVYVAIAHVNENNPFLRVDMRIPESMVTFMNAKKRNIEVSADDGDFFVPIVAIKKKEKSVPAKHKTIGYLGNTLFNDAVSVS